MTGSWVGSWVGSATDLSAGARSGAALAIVACTLLAGLATRVRAPWPFAAAALVFPLAALRAAAIEHVDAAHGDAARGGELRPAWRSGLWRPPAAHGPRFVSVAGAALRAPTTWAECGELIAVAAPGTAVRAARGPEDQTSTREEHAGPTTLWYEPYAGDVVRIARPRRTAAPGPLARALTRLRALGLARVRELDGPEAALLAALLFGERTELSGATTDLFTRTGTRHALALSGLHVGLVAALVAWPLGGMLARLARCLCRAARLRIRPRDELVRAGLVLALISLGGAGPPVTRAGITLALALVAPALAAPRRPPDAPDVHRGVGAARGDPGRRADTTTLLALALLLEGLVAPRGLAGLGLWLSYTATAALLFATGGAAELFRRALPGAGRIAATDPRGRARSTAWVVPAQRSLDFARTGCAASVVASLATLPPIWSQFGEWSPIGVLGSVAIVPVLALALGAGWAWTLVPVFPAAAPELAAELLVGLLHALDPLPGTPLQLPPRPWALLASGAGAALVWLRSKGERRWAARAAAAVFGATLLPWSCGPRHLEIVALDVGHGTAVALRAPGAGTWLFDAGTRDRRGVGRRALAPLLRSWEARELHVVASHADRDHVGSLPWIVERWPPALWAGALTAHLGERFPHAVPRLDLDAGTLQLAGGGRSPGPRMLLLRGGVWAGNEGSRSLLIEYRGVRVLLTGDAEQHGLAGTLEAGLLDGPLDLLLVPHHGSRTALLGALLDRTAPAQAWISAEPGAPALEILERRGIPCALTGRDGALSWATDVGLP
ncbi:MAG: MBL fold metallo-hydrolase [bacterium]|nr:MBL fold metallo-hydrolase [bacterium]